MNIILGSASPRRREMLAGLFAKLEVISPSIDEKTFPGETPEEFTVRISKEKAREIRKNTRFEAPSLLITSDTVVAVDEKILGKPSDHTGAVSMLRMLSGKRHRVISSITLEHIDEGLLSTRTDYEVTRVSFMELSELSIEEYLGKIDYMDKAGSYAIQESGELIIDHVEGSITNVIGFPLRKFFSMLAGMNLVAELFQFIPAHSGREQKPTCS
jgi:septum formation protein